MKFAWLTDIHLNFLYEDKRKQYYDEINRNCDAIVISGDIAEAKSVTNILQEMAHHIKKPIYFVLGNHDFYHGQINDVRDSMRLLTKNNPHLFWLGCCDPIKLDADTILVGEDGWVDGRYGDYANTPVSLNDSRLIADLFQERILGRFQLLEKMQQLADKDANNLYTKLETAAKENPKKMVVVTHVPPFRETAMHEGKISTDDFLPFFSSKVTGDMLMKFANEHTSIEILVLCGHSHDWCSYHPLDNLTVFVGKAEYTRPCSQGVIETKSLDFCIDSETSNSMN
ncbi:MAG: metallophosphoesterase [Gammaproteobacteria bacterium]|jgi:Icc-related predicted phosphoesterase|nr:metallophosphoesterase [Gammaproteobacteria bacterium]